MEESFQFIDDTNDKKYFTIVPHLIINNYKAQIIGTYAYIKHRCGENKEGLWYENKSAVARKLELSEPTMLKYLHILEKDKRIELIGTKIFKTSPVNVYKICDIWKENIETAQKRQLKNNRFSIEDGKRQLKNKVVTELKNNGLNNNIYNNNTITNVMVAKPTVVADKLPINELIEFFKPINPSYERLFSNKSQRAALERLYLKIGEEKLKQILEVLPKTNQRQFAPVITTPIDLENKLGQLMIFIQKEKSVKPNLIKINSNGEIVNR